MEKRSYGQLSLTERIEIYRLHADGKSQRFIAGVLQRSVSTISRELMRNSKASKKWSGGYDPQRAQKLMLRRHARGRTYKLERQPELRREVLQRLAAGWSPEQIAGRFAQGPAATGSAMNRFIATFIGAVALSKKRCIVACRAKSTAVEGGEEMARGRLHPSWTEFPFMIVPPVVAERARSGDWEADLMSFRKPGQFLLVAHERRSRRRCSCARKRDRPKPSPTIFAL